MIVFQNWEKVIGENFQFKFLHSRNLAHELEDQQRVVISTILPHDINQCYKTELAYLAELKTINGDRIYNMKGLVDTMERLKQSREEWVVFQFTSEIRLVFPLQEALVATEELMTDNNIPKAWDKIAL